MTLLYRLFLTVACLLLLSRVAYSQTPDNKPISGMFVALRFEQFAREIESRTSYRFYFNPKEVDSLVVNINFTQKPLSVVLSQVFSGTNFQYAIDAQQRVFITAGRGIRTELPIGFFNRQQATAEEDTLVESYLTEQEKRKVILETKLYNIGPRSNPIRGTSNLAGHVRNLASGEPVIGAAVYIENPRIGVTTDQFGYFSITLPRGRHELKVRSIGMKDTKRQLMLYGDGKLEIEMEDDVVPLREFTLEAEKDRNVSGLQMGMERLDIRAMRQVPSVFGETDLLKVVLTLPGVKSVGESSVGLNVRGGATDQNLILYNDATIYNPSHLFGFFSAFNPDMIKNVELYKSGVPSRYGGRLSSVLEVNTRDGNRKKHVLSGGIGLLTGRLTAEGPIIKEKSSFLIGARTTYSDWLLGSLRQSTFKNSSAGFSDLNVHISHDFNEKNSLYLTGYYSKDRFKLNSDTAYSYRNQSATLKYKHIFTNKFYGVLTGGFSQYDYAVSSDQNPINAYKLNFDVAQKNLKVDFNYYPTSKHTVDFGASTVKYQLHPGNYQPLGEQALAIPDVVSGEQGLESAIYVGDRFDINPRLSIQFGIRYSMFNYLGPKDVFAYPAGVPRSEANIIDTLSYGKNKNIQTYHGPEYRFSARFALSPDASVKVSYNRMRQYIQMLSNTTAIAPTDIWKLSDPNIRPQVGDQYSVGLYKNLRSNTIELSVEGYYKSMQNILDYKSGAQLLLNHHIETDVVNAEGKAYGIELMLKKLSGRLNGWASYTYARTLLRANDPITSEVINKGEWYPSNYDKPHDFTIIGNYRINKRFSTSLNVTYSTGRPITLPLAIYNLGGSVRVFYSDRNQYRIPDYFRTDISLNIEGNHRVKKLAHSSWTVGVYNLTARRNAYSIYFKSEGGNVRGYKLSIFGQAIPTITYNFRF
ncbi:TonB-dependent receptor [Tellurirhabdus bombi]|uniref:TonB-dependent receptor n=1 Tax=Tellurirhabdus bombi TaxID=2907205 RepID=UPI001F3E8683|nr:carboxypeptidase-like regulatory domain-containing protein [Tellurirhabdus bombi]